MSSLMPEAKKVGYFSSPPELSPIAQTFLNKKFLLQKENLTVVSPIYLLTQKKKREIFPRHHLSVTSMK